MYPLSNQRLAWDYKNANVSSLQKVFLNMIDLNKLFSNGTGFFSISFSINSVFLQTFLEAKSLHLMTKIHYG